MSRNKKKQFSFVFDQKLRGNLEKLAEKKRRSMASEINIAVADRLELDKAGFDSVAELLKLIKETPVL